jgi:GT2 family glycosyltransferase
LSILIPVTTARTYDAQARSSVETTDDVSVTVVICTIRSTGLAAAVASVLANPEPFELIVVAQGRDAARASDALAELPSEQRNDPRLRIVHDPGRGLSRARNVGVREATGSIVLFTDDDCTVASDWVAAHVACYRERPDAMLVYGTVVPPEGYTGADGFVPTFDPGPSRRGARTDGGIVMGMGANMSVRRALFGQIGPIDEQLGAGAPLLSGEDVDVSFRVYAAGLVALADSRPLVVHELGVRRRGRESYAIWRRDGLGTGAAVAKLARMGQWHAAWSNIVVLIELWRDVLFGNVLHLRRPFGLARVGMLTLGTLEGLWRGIGQPLRRAQRSYVYGSRG